jgi:uncharacterized protein YcnI
MATTLPTRRRGLGGRASRRTWRCRARAATCDGRCPRNGAHRQHRLRFVQCADFAGANESDTASTVKLEVQLPKDTPFLSVSSKPIPGWTVKMTEAPLPEPVESEGTKITKAVTTVTWTASEAAAVKPGEYQDFSISAGPLPKPGTLELPAVQTYSDGKVVKWNQPTPASGEEPECPTPTFVITAAEPGSAEGGDVEAAPAPTTGEDGREPADSTDPLARGARHGRPGRRRSRRRDCCGCSTPVQRKPSA